MWTDPRWFIHQLEVRICFWSSTAWPSTFWIWAVPFCILVFFLYNDVNTKRAVIGRRPWSIGVQIHGWRHGRLVFFVLFNMARDFENVWDYFGLKQVKASKKISKSYLQRKENGEKERKRALYNLRMPKLQEIFTTVAFVWHYEKRAVLQNVFAIILLWTKKRLWKTFRRTCRQVR